MTVSRPRQDTPRRRPPNPRAGVRRRTGAGGAANPIVSLGATAWYDAHDGSGLQLVPSRIGSKNLTLGSTSGVDTNDPTWNAGGGAPYWEFDGTDDYLQLPAGDTPTFTASTGSFTVLLVARVVGAGTQFLFDGQSAGSNGFALFVASGSLVARTGGATTAVTTTGIGSGLLADDTLRAFGAVQSSGTITAYERTVGASASVSTTGVGTITHLPPRVFAPAFAVLFPATGDVTALVVWTSALTPTQLNTASDYLLGVYS